MVHFFQGENRRVLAVGSSTTLSKTDLEKLIWLFDGARLLENQKLEGFFVGPRKEMITPWSTNAVEITLNMGIAGIERIEEFFATDHPKAQYDPMLQAMYDGLDQDVFNIAKEPDPVIFVENIEAYNEKEGLALSNEEIEYLNDLSRRLGRKLTDSEVFGFSQVNSEHCRHKIFNGTFIIDGEEKQSSLFKLIKKTSEKNPNYLVSAYKDNVAFIQGPLAKQFAPVRQDTSDFFVEKDIETVLSLKAETHNFPTTVEPFNGAATGSGGEIRDRLGGGKGSLPLAGTAVYMTSYPRPGDGRKWEKAFPERPWLYQTPEQILIKASNGASDFGNKFGQPLICGSVLTFEHFENYHKFAFDKVIMLAGGIGFAKKDHSLKDTPAKGDQVVVLGGDNYRIGMGGGAVSSVATGEFANSIELNAVQRSNPEMQKRVMNAIRAMAESDENPIVSIHDHGAGGHLNCLSELVEETGGTIHLDQLPVGDPTLSAKEIVGNESQERMGLVLHEKDVEKLKKVADRERAPMYVVGQTTGDMQFRFVDDKGNVPIDLQLADMFGNPPKTVMKDEVVSRQFEDIKYDVNEVENDLEMVLQLEAVACKDWLTNKVDRSVTGKVACQQCVGEIQLPLSDLGATTIDYSGSKGVATSIGHAPGIGLVDAKAGSVISVAEALTNIVWAPLTHGIKGISLSANWMWPCRNSGEDARLYEAVDAVSRFACDLGINIPTGKDSLSMTQKYPDGEAVISPGTVIISAAAETDDVRRIVKPVLKKECDTYLIYIDLSSDTMKIGGSSFAQIRNKLGNEVPTIKDSNYFRQGFETIQQLVREGLVLAGHDVSAGGMVTTLLEMCFANKDYGVEADLSNMMEEDPVKLLFSENPAVVIQVADLDTVGGLLEQAGIRFEVIGRPVETRHLKVKTKIKNFSFDIDHMRDVWFRTSYLLDRNQSGEKKAEERFNNYKKQALEFQFPAHFQGTLESLALINPQRVTKAAIIREKGVNGDREMAYSLYKAGFAVKDVHMTDLISGRETLEEIDFIVFVGGFSNSDVMGSSKGWAGAFRYNEKAQKALENFYARPDTLSLGVCNGCQLMVNLDLINPEHEKKARMLHNDSHKFESNFVTMTIQENHSVMLKSLAGSKIGVWVAHGEGKFCLPMEENAYHIPGKYGYEAYPSNPNGSDYNAAAICSQDGRHLAMMPHLERSVFPWQWSHYPQGRSNDAITPWMEAFVNARKWIEEKHKQKE
ncbi:phosphoribosylformylglycinamidine synthase [Thermophagus sp. OGC60D27]|uniref:phosphoribosylformylglycinamidine synthase n=1 Tax=Thermophagus sp. OGC60D27 TaxID=3458415 RepID=UPI004037DC84